MERLDLGRLFSLNKKFRGTDLLAENTPGYPFPESQEALRRQGWGPAWWPMLRGQNQVLSSLSGLIKQSILDEI